MVTITSLWGIKFESESYWEYFLERVLFCSRTLLKMSILIIYFELDLKCYKILKIRELSNIFKILGMLCDIVRNLKRSF